MLVPEQSRTNYSKGGSGLNRGPVLPNLFGPRAALSWGGTGSGRGPRVADPPGYIAISERTLSRTIVIGDVHGCAAELEELLALVGPTSSDAVLFVGDLVARGPNSRGVLRLFRQVGARGVRGNHEERLLAAYRARLTGAPLPRLSTHHERVLRELSDEDWSLLEALPLYLDLPDHDVRLVHAGVVPGRRFDELDAWTLTNIRSLDEDGKPSDQPGTQPWGERYRGGPHVVFGHDSRRKLQLHPFATGLDTGCVYGGSLTALVLPCGHRVPFPQERRDLLVSVPAKDRYYVPSALRG